MAKAARPPVHPGEEGGRPLLKGAGRKGSRQRKRYVLTVCSTVPDDLAERISALHAAAIRQGEERSGSKRGRRTRG